MRNLLIFMAALLTGFLLSGCEGIKPPTPVSNTSTPPPPQVSTEVIATAASQSVNISDQQIPTSTNLPDQEPASTLAPEPTPTVPAPTQTPTTEKPAPTKTATPTKSENPTEAATPTQTAAPVQQESSSSGAAAGSGTGSVCEDKAAYYGDVTVPDNTVFQQSIEFTKTWQVKNAGSCTWDGYSLVFGGGSSLNAPLTSPIALVRPGELVEISVKLKSPNQGGVYTSLWEFQNRDGKRFGVNAGGLDFIWAKIAVSTIPDGSDLPGSQPLPGPATCQTQQAADVVNQLLALINQARAEAKLVPFTLQPQLSAAALGHSQDMACKNYFDHVGSDGSDWYKRIKAQAYPYLYASENIYYDFADPGSGAQDAFDWWMKSKVHHDNMLSSKVSEIGIGYAYDLNNTHKGYYTLNFGKR